MISLTDTIEEVNLVCKFINHSNILTIPDDIKSELSIEVRNL